MSDIAIASYVMIGTLVIVAILRFQFDWNWSGIVGVVFVLGAIIILVILIRQALTELMGVRPRPNQN